MTTYGTNTLPVTLSPRAWPPVNAFSTSAAEPVMESRNWRVRQIRHRHRFCRRSSSAHPSLSHCSAIPSRILRSHHRVRGHRTSFGLAAYAFRSAPRVTTRRDLPRPSTPNKSSYAESRADAGPNPFHVHEFEYAEFQAALIAVFPAVSIYFQNRVEAFAFTQPALPLENSTTIPATPEHAQFFVALCLFHPHPVNGFVYLPTASNSPARARTSYSQASG